MFEIYQSLEAYSLYERCLPYLTVKNTQFWFVFCQLQKKTVTTYLYYFKYGTQFSYALTLQAVYQEESLGQGKIFSCTGFHWIWKPETDGNTV